MHKEEAYSLCREHMHRYVRVQTADGNVTDGIIEHVDNDYVYLAVPIGPGEEGDMRGYYPPPYYGSYSSYYPPYDPYLYVYPPYPSPFPYYPRPRFRREVLPLSALVALSLLPYY